jgi:hypothetical protein
MIQSSWLALSSNFNFAGYWLACHFDVGQENERPRQVIVSRRWSSLLKCFHDVSHGMHLLSLLLADVGQDCDTKLTPCIISIPAIVGKEYHINNSRSRLTADVLGDKKT